MYMQAYSNFPQPGSNFLNTPANVGRDFAPMNSQFESLCTSSMILRIKIKRNLNFVNKPFHPPFQGQQYHRLYWVQQWHKL